MNSNDTSISNQGFSDMYAREPVVVGASSQSRSVDDVKSELSEFFRREGYPELAPGAVSSLTPEELAELASWPPDSTERVARTYLAGLLRVLHQLADVFGREGKSELFDEIRSFLTPESLAELAALPVDEVERMALHHLDYGLRTKGMIPRHENMPAICADCGKVWTSKGYTENAPIKDGWPQIPDCAWCVFVAHGYAIPRPTSAESKPPRELLDPRASAKLN